MIEAKEKFRAYLLREGLNFTRPREIILDAFCSAASHLSAKELHLRLRGKLPQIGYATVYRVLKLFAECDIADKRNFGDKVDRYEPTSGQEYHDHLICIRCGSIVEFQEPRAIQILVDGQTDFERNTMPLQMAGAQMTIEPQKNVEPLSAAQIRVGRRNQFRVQVLVGAVDILPGTAVKPQGCAYRAGETANQPGAPWVCAPMTPMGACLPCP